MAGPHEVLGMSRLLGISTTEFLALFADNGGTTLRFGEEDGRCVFVTESGCRVHPRRPLVCRLYPLGRATDGTGGERFSKFPRQEGCEAEFGTAGTIADFLDSQGVAPYFEWSLRYGEVYRRMLRLLERVGVESKIEVGAAAKGKSGAAGKGPEPDQKQDGAPDRASDRDPVSSWQDIDASLAPYCAAKGIGVPDGIEESIDLHLAAMKEWLDGLEARIGAAPDDPDGEGRT